MDLLLSRSAKYTNMGHFPVAQATLGLLPARNTKQVETHKVYFTMIITYTVPWVFQVFMQACFLPLTGMLQPAFLLLENCSVNTFFHLI